MEERFEYLLRGGAGWTQARLTLSDDSALIEYDSASMGIVPVRYIVHCEHKKLSDSHGLLMTTSIEQFRAQQNQFGGYVVTDAKETVDIAHLIDPDTDESMLEYFKQLDIEYIRLPQPQLRLDEPGGNWGIEDWTNTFSLVLMIHFAGFWYDESAAFKKTPLGRSLEHLDKMHFAAAQGKYILKL